MIPFGKYSQMNVADLLEAVGYWEYLAQKCVRYYFKHDEVLGPLLEHIDWLPNGGHIYG